MLKHSEVVNDLIFQKRYVDAFKCSNSSSEVMQVFIFSTDLYLKLHLIETSVLIFLFKM